MSTRMCKRCGMPYSMVIPYSKARADIRDYCHDCIMLMQSVEPKKQTEVQS